MKFAYPNLLPKLSDAEFQSLKADIAAHGVQVQIEIDAATGECLDGYHRYLACQQLGITDYPTISRSFTSEAQRIWHAVSLNIVRRHGLTKSQIAGYAVKYALPTEAEKAKERQQAGLKKGTQFPVGVQVSPRAKAAEKVAAQAGISATTVKRAKLVMKEAPELFEKVLAGEMSVQTAMREIDGTRKERKSAADSLKRPHNDEESLYRFIKTLHAELKRKRKENHDVRNSRNWNVESILKRELIEILDWIEDQLDKVQPLTCVPSKTGT